MSSATDAVLALWSRSADEVASTITEAAAATADSSGREAAEDVASRSGGEGPAESGKSESCLVGGQSFAAATKVLMPSGALVAISKLKPGDKVVATNTVTGKTQAEPVAAVLVHHDTDLYDLKVRAAGHDSVIQTASNHLFWEQSSRRWVKAAALNYGTDLRTPSDSSVTVLSGWALKVTTGWMWDLTVPGNNDHDFYVAVAATAVLVHNTTCGPIDDLPGESQTYVDRTIGSSIRNVGMSATHEEFADTLANNGWTARTSGDGAVQIFTKDGTKYVLREKASTYDGWSAELTPADSPRVTVKIRLGVSG